MSTTIELITKNGLQKLEVENLLHVNIYTFVEQFEHKDTSDNKPDITDYYHCIGLDIENNKFYAYLKIPSEVVEKFYYDVVIEFSATSDIEDAGRNLIR